MLDLKPKTDAEQAIYDAFVLLLADRESLTFSPVQFVEVCKSSRDYALTWLTRTRSRLVHGVGGNRAQIANMVRTMEWELIRPAAYIDSHHLDTEDAPFILGCLQMRPQEFSSDDLHALLTHYKAAEHPLRQAALAALTNKFVSFADRITDEPPKLSEDIASLKESIRNYGFNPDLNAVLQKIDQELDQSSDAFDQAATMKHIRSFFEELHESVGKELQARKPKTVDATPLSKSGQAIDYLERKSVITTKIKDLGRCLYAILSDGDYGVHALKANRDYTRLCRNIVVEYAVTLFFELNRRLAEPGDN